MIICAQACFSGAGHVTMISIGQLHETLEPLAYNAIRDVLTTWRIELAEVRNETKTILLKGAIGAIATRGAKRSAREKSCEDYANPTYSTVDDAEYEFDHEEDIKNFEDIKATMETAGCVTVEMNATEAATLMCRVYEKWYGQWVGRNPVVMHVLQDFEILESVRLELDGSEATTMTPSFARFVRGLPRTHLQRALVAYVPKSYLVTRHNQETDTVFKHLLRAVVEEAREKGLGKVTLKYDGRSSVCENVWCGFKHSPQHWLEDGMLVIDPSASVVAK